MAAPRKKKKVPPFDVTGIDFSVITTALQTGGRMIEQIMNGIQYGSPEVRLLMLEECDLILECRVCRGLFRALPNFIAHKRVYCCQPFCEHSFNAAFQAATAPTPQASQAPSPTPPQEPPIVVVEPTAPERESRQCNIREKTSGVYATAKLGGDGDMLKEKNGPKSAQSKTPSNASAGVSVKKSESKPPQEAAVESQGAVTRSRLGDKNPAASAGEITLAATVSQIESGQLGNSKEYALYTAAAEKMEREKNAMKSCPPLHMVPIPSNPHAVFVSNKKPHESVNQALTEQAQEPKDSSGKTPAIPQVASALKEKVPDKEKELKDKAKNSSGGVAKQASNEKAPPQPQSSKATASSSKVASGSAVTAPEVPAKRKTTIAKGTLRSVTRVVRELRQKKEALEQREEEGKLAAGKSRVKPGKRGPSAATPISKAVPELSVADSTANTSGGETPPSAHKKEALASVRGVDGGGMSLRAVVKRCLTGRPGALRVSSLVATGVDRNSDADSLSEVGSYSDLGEATPSPSGLLRQRGEKLVAQSAMDVDNMRCKVCNMAFLSKKSLQYHCKVRHSGQRTIYPCPYCPRVFYYFHGLTRHLNTNHKKHPSDIDRMRKGLRRKAYTQDMASPGNLSASFNSDRDGQVLPAGAAQKAAALSRNTSDSGTKAGQSSAVSMQVPGRRRRVEVISSSSGQAKGKKSADVYQKVFASRKVKVSGRGRQAKLQTSPSKESVCRTRKIVAKALRTTRSKRVYSRSEEDLVLNVAPTSKRANKHAHNAKEHKFSKKTPLSVSKSSVSSSSVHQESDSDSTGSSEDSSTGKDVNVGPSPAARVERQPAIQPTLVTGASAMDVGPIAGSEKNTAANVQQISSKGRAVSAESAKETRPDAPVSTASLVKPEITLPNSENVHKGASPSKVSAVALTSGVSVVLTDGLRMAPSLPKTSVTVTNIALMPAAMSAATSAPGLQTRTKALAAVSGKVVTSGSGQALTLVNSVAGSLPKEGSSGQREVSPQVMVARTRSAGQASLTNSDVSPSQPTSTLLACPHCHRAFGRKISLESHAKICVRGKPSSAAAGPRRGAPEDSRARSLTRSVERRVNSRAGESGEGIDRRAKGRESGEARSTARSETRALRDRTSPAGDDSSAEKTGMRGRGRESQSPTVRPPVNAHSTGKEKAKAPDVSRSTPKLNANPSPRNRSSRESSVDSEVVFTDRASRGRRKADAENGRSLSRDSSADSVRTESSDGRLSQTTMRRSMRAKPNARQNLDGSAGKAVANTDKMSNQQHGKVDNLLTISRQRLSEQLRVAASTKDRDIIASAEEGMKTKSNASHSSEKNLSTRSTVQKTITTSVLRKTPKEKQAASETSAVKTVPQKRKETDSTDSQDEAKTPQGIRPPEKCEGLDAVQGKKAKCEQSGPKEPSSVREQQASSVKVVSPPTELLSPSAQQPQEETSMASQRPRRKRRLPAKILDKVLDSTTSFKRPRREHQDPVTGGATASKPLPPIPQLPSPAHLESQRGQGKEEGREGEEEKSVTVVEEIWVEKKPGRPSERVKSNRIYVVEPARAGRLTCQDTRKVVQIVDETGLTCLQCDQQFTSVSNLRRHAIRHLGWRRFKCRLCRFCSYNRSECNTHIMRTHPERLRFSGSGGARIDTFITDLNRQAASVRSMKKRQTLNSRRQGWDGGAGAEELRSSRFSKRRVKDSRADGRKAENDPLAAPDPDLGVSKSSTRSNNSSGGGGRKSASPAPTRTATRGRPSPSSTTPTTPSTASLTTPTIPTPSNATPATSPAPSTFNISTRNSPRKFDTRPYPRPDIPIATLGGGKVPAARSLAPSPSSTVSQAATVSASGDVGRTPAWAGEGVTNKYVVISTTKQGSVVQRSLATTAVGVQAQRGDAGLGSQADSIVAPSLSRLDRRPEVRPQRAGSTVKAPEVRSQIAGSTVKAPEVRPQKAGSAIKAPEVRPQIAVCTVKAPEVKPQIAGSTVEAPEVRPQRAGSDIKAPEVRSQIASSTVKAPEVRSQIAGSNVKAPEVRPQRAGSAIKAQDFLETIDGMEEMKKCVSEGPSGAAVKTVDDKGLGSVPTVESEVVLRGGGAEARVSVEALPSLPEQLRSCQGN